MARAKKQKQEAPKSKEELLAELKKNTDFMFKMKFLKEEFWPALIGASTSIEDAQQLLYGFNTAIMQEFLGRMKDVKLSELKLVEKMEKNNPKFVESKALLDLFQDMNVFEAKEHVESMRQEIETFMSDEKRTRTLDTLKPKWLDEI